MSGRRGWGGEGRRPAAAAPEGDWPETVAPRYGTERGRVVGKRRCTLEGCGGWRVGVRWEDGRLTWPCLKGMEPTITPGLWRIM